MLSSCRKRILATGTGALLRTQLPDSTVISEPSPRESSGFSCDTSTVPNVSKKLPQIRRSSVISLDYDSDHSDSIINKNPVHSKSIHADNETICDSPSTYSPTTPSFNFSKKTSTDVDGSDLFFTPEKPETVVKNKPKTSTAVDLDDFYYDDFDIDDLSDSDIPQYFDEPPALSVPPQKPSATTTTIKEGGPSTSSWEKKPTTPVSAPKAPKICSPGQDSITPLQCLTKRFPTHFY